MSRTDPILTSLHQEVSLEAVEAQYRQSMKAYGTLLERITPWLFDVGSWVFGGLIAFTILVMASLITVGPIDLPIKISTAAFALALPLDVTGLVLLRLMQDLKPSSFEEEIARAFQEVGLTLDEQQVPSFTALETLRKRGTRTVLYCVLGILALSGSLTLAAMAAALWHMAWWIAVAFLVMVLVSVVIALVAMIASQQPASTEERKQRRRYRDELVRQAKERSRQVKEQK